jgi:NAD-reducing hydrogenase small subunit
MSAAKPKIATISLAGCFGCHMSLLDIDERILKLIELVDFDKSPINDIKEFTGRCAVGIIEGGCCNEENVHVLQKYRQHCDTLVVIGECATMGGLPAMRNHSLARVPGRGVSARAHGSQSQPEDSQRS